MATKVKRGGSAAKKGSTAKAAKAAPAKAAPEKTRRTAEDVDALVPEFLSKIGEGATMRALKQEFGFSDDGPIRAALYRAGYDRKGEEHGEEAGSIDASKAAGKKQLIKLRADEGAAWYRLAFLGGITESEAKQIVADGGGNTGRVYVSKEPDEKPAAKKAGSTAKKSGSKKATAADPS